MRELCYPRFCSVISCMMNPRKLHMRIKLCLRNSLLAAQEGETFALLPANRWIYIHFVISNHLRQASIKFNHCAKLNSRYINSKSNRY